MKARIELSVVVPKTPRVLQMAGMFDLPVDVRNTVSWDHHLPVEDRPWSVGLIVGPSGAGKSVLARRLWPDRVRTGMDWPADAAVLDAFEPGLGIREITGLLTSVGLGSVPAWIRPYYTLSTGEAFRADMARAIAEDQDPIVVDEFTSVVDRQVAQVASHTVQKAIRAGGRQFVAVTCHYDVTDWLQPDWVYDVAAQSFQWRSVQPHPPVRLDIHASSRSDWTLFARHHYLNHQLMSAAQCFTAYVGDTPVAFTSYRHFPHYATKNIKMGHRLVVLPDWQGLGIAGRLDDWLGQYLWDKGFRYRNVVSHPAMIRFYARSPRWTNTGERKTRVTGHDTVAARGGRPRARTGPKVLAQVRVGNNAKKALERTQLSARRLSVASFEYRPPKGPASA